MKHLVRGAESKARILLLLEFTNISSEPQIKAVNDYLCEGLSLERSSERNVVEKQNLNRALSILDNKARIYEALKEEEGVYKSVK